jgi:hypothetical protein
LLDELRRLLRTASIHLVLGVMMFGCAPSWAQQAPSGIGIPLRPLLLAEVQKAARARFHEFDEARVQFRSDSSRAVPGLIYEWAVYRPPGTADIALRTVAGALGPRTHVLHKAADWSQVTKPWSPSEPGEAVLACIDLVAVLGARRDPYRPPVALADSSLSLSIRPTSLKSWREATGARLDEHGVWTVGLAVLEPGQAMKYRCVFGPTVGASLEAVDSIPGAGLLPYGP